MIRASAEEFFHACGARAPLRLEVEHRERGEIVQRTLRLPFALVGRDQRADLFLKDEAVSRCHTYLQMVGGRWWWVDLASRTGTHLAGNPSVPSSERRKLVPAGQLTGPLLHSQYLGIGPYTIRPSNGAASAEDATGASPNPLSSLADDPSLPRWSLEFRGEVAQQRTWIVDRPLTLVGRASFCKVRLRSPLVSRVHCALLNTTSGLWFVDLLGRKGTFVKGTAVRWARLEPDDELQIHPFLIRVRNLTPPMQWTDSLSPLNNSIPHALITPAPMLPASLNESQLLPLISQFSLMQQQMFEQFQHTLLMMAQTFGNLHREQLALIREELDQIRDLTRELQSLKAEQKQQLPPSRPAPTQSPIPPRPSVPKAAPAPRADTPPSAAARPASPGAELPPAATAARCENDIHIWLSQRMAALQRERQSRWQKILNVLTGK